MMSIALLLRRSLRPLTLSGVIESTVSTKRTINNIKHIPTKRAELEMTLAEVLNLYCHADKLHMPNFRKIASQCVTHTLHTLTSIQLEF